MLSGISRFICCLALPSAPSFLAPDEGTYANMATWVSESRDVNNFPLYGPGLYNTSKTLVLPAAGLIQLGVNQLDAVRLTSASFGLLSVFFFAKILFLILNVNCYSDLIDKRSKRIVLTALVTFAFFPSNFLWSIVGIRESASIASLLICIYSLIKLSHCDYQQIRSKVFLFAVFGILIGIILSFGARPQTALVFVVFFCGPFLLFIQGVKRFLTIGLLVLGTISGFFYSATPNIAATTKLEWAQLEPEATPKVNASRKEDLALNEFLGRSCESDGEVILISKVNLVCRYIAVIEKIPLSLRDALDQAPVKNPSEIIEKREANRLQATSALPKSNCLENFSDNVGSLVCIISELPKSSFDFLLRPMIFLDFGSLSSNLASVENILWTLLLLTFAVNIYLALRRKVRWDTVIPTSSFVIAFSSAASLYQGNLGTAFRHKNSILWGLLLVCATVMVFNGRQSQESSKKQYPTSQGD